MTSRTGVLAAALVLYGLLEGLLALVRPPEAVIVMTSLGYGVLTFAAILYGSRIRPGSAGESVRILISPAVLILLATSMSLVLAYVVLQCFPNSADEFGYTYLAATLRHHRLWNQSFPSALQDVLHTIYVPDMNGKRFSQYPPGWPAVLAVFPSVQTAALANPILGAFSGVFLSLGLKELRTPPKTMVALLIITLFAPFTLFNNASFFNHTLTGTCLLAIAWLDLRDRRVGSAWHPLGIGLAFSVLLTTRYEIFLIALVLYAADGLLRRRWRFVTASLPAAVAALPIVLAFGYYNWKITGSPFTTTLSWGSPGIGYGPYSVGIETFPLTPTRILVLTGRLVLRWAEFIGFAILPFLLVALWRRALGRTLRWFDLVLPALVLFFAFYPDTGGFQYGPRYWFAGWVLVPLTIAGAFRDANSWRVRRWSFSPLTLALLQGAAYAGFIAGYAVFARIQVDVRKVPLEVAGTAPPPAVVVFPSNNVFYVPWQIRDQPFDAKDYTRNGPDGLGPVVLARDLGPARTALLCQQFSDRTVWRLVMQGAPPVDRLEPACRH
jgi:hypothetical protein